MDAKYCKSLHDKQPYFEIHWTNFSYTVHNSCTLRFIQRLQGFKNLVKSKRILNDVSGKVCSGEMVAIVGPSGAGKSTFLDCIGGRCSEGLSGKVFFRGKHLHTPKISFVAQRNTFLTNLTVMETIHFATQLQMNSRRLVEQLLNEDGENVSRKSYRQCCIDVTDRVLNDLNLNECENNRVSNCSGGQLKRLAIAQELVGQPRVLILDEPTSGLDSTSALNVVQLLRTICESHLNLTVMATIHQPSFKILNLFRKLFVLTSNGEIMYGDCPSTLVKSLEEFGIHCDSRQNPAELVTEIGCGQHGVSVLNNMIESYRNLAITEIVNQPVQNVNHQGFFNHLDFFINWRHIHILVKRNTIKTVKDPLAFGLRVFNTVFIPLFALTVYGTEIGKRGGCPPKFGSDFEPSQLAFISKEIEAEFITSVNNLGQILCAVLFAMFNTMLPLLIRFPTEMVILKSEHGNHWYNLNSFYCARILSEIPIQITLVCVFWPMMHILENQIMEVSRIAAIILIILLSQFITETISLTTGALIMNSTVAALFTGECIVVVFSFLLSGGFVKLKSMPPFFYLLSHFDFVRFACEGFIVALYGFDRCADSKSDLKEGRDAFVVWMSAMLGIYKDDVHSTTSTDANISEVVNYTSPSERFVEEMIDTIAGNFISDDNRIRSLSMNQWGLEDWHLYRTLIALLVYLFVTHVIAYSAILYKVRSKN